MTVTSKAVRVKTHKFHTVVAKLTECKMAINFHDMESRGNVHQNQSLKNDCAIINANFYCMRRPNKQSCLEKRNYNTYKAF